MSDQRDLRVEVDDYNKKHGRETEGAEGYRNFLNAVYTSPNWLRRLPAWKEQQRKQELNKERPRPTTSAQDSALVREWLDVENQRRKDFNAALTTGSGLPMLELGFANGQVTFENAVAAAHLWFESKQQAANDARTAEVNRAAGEQQAEDVRVNTILTAPMPSNDRVWAKYKKAVQLVTNVTVETWQQHWTFDEIRRQIETAQNLAALECANILTGEVTPEEWQKAQAFIDVNQLDPTFASSWGIAVAVLVEHGVIRKRTLPTMKVIADPVLPEAVERPAPEYQPQGRAAEQAQREADTLREIRTAMGDHLNEISIHDSIPVEDIVVFKAYDELMQQRAELSRTNVRRSIFYNILKVRGTRPRGFTDDEISSWAEDATAMRAVSAGEFKRQMAMFGDVRAHRAPSKDTGLLEQIVKNTARKG